MSNNIQGKLFLLEIFEGGSYIAMGGLNTKDFTIDNPVADATSSSTPSSSNFTEACHTGYSTMTLNGSGLIDTRSSATLQAYKNFVNIALSSTKVANLRLTDTISSYSGNFLITSFGESAEQNALIAFTAAFQNEGIISYT